MLDRIARRLETFREVMRKYHIDAWIAPTNDFHGSEYIGEHFKVRKYLTGFTGSVGTVVVMEKGVWLWVDGRYFVQAEKQLAGTEIHLFKSGQPEVPTLEEFLAEEVKEGETVGFDGRVISAAEGKKLRTVLEEKKINISSSRDIVEESWIQRPPMEKTHAWFLKIEEAGEDRSDKLQRIRKKMEELGADAHFVTSLDDIAWIYNMRGQDIACSPVIQAYTMITLNQAILFVQDGALNKEQKEELEKEKIYVKDYKEIIQFTENLPACVLLLDPDKVSDELYHSFSDKVKKIEEMDPSVRMKAVKNSAEIAQLRSAHLRDGVAMTRYIYWLKHVPEKVHVTEMEAAAHLEELRKEQEGYLEPSFETISAYGANAAMCHYISTEETDTEIRKEGFYLVDAGGQYRAGTTDITRTIVMGKVTEEQKLHYTLVLKGMIDLAKARFHQGTCGQMLDYLARGPLLESGLDYNHGTGHGVGALLNVHEAPNYIHWRLPDHLKTVFQEGMLTSDEPGIYIEGSHGIRTENLILCVRDPEEGFLHFETMTICPIDLSAVKFECLDITEKKWLNQYHEKVYNGLGKFLPENERKWLKKVTEPIS